MPQLQNTENSESSKKAGNFIPNKRQTAYKIKINTLLEEKYVKTDGWNPNFIIMNGIEISRVNVIGAVISNELETFGSVAYRNVMIDDGTGKISLRNFENPEALSGIEVADVVLVIGKLREYGSERYILSEIVKKIEDKRWIEQRNLEIELLLRKIKRKMPAKENEEAVVTEEVVEKAENFIAKDAEIKNNSHSVYELVKDLDKGDGADYEEVLKKANFNHIKNAENVIRKLLESGEIFEIRAGRLKVI